MFRISVEVLIQINWVESIGQRTSNLIVAPNVDGYGLDYRMFCDFIFRCKSGMRCGSVCRIIISEDEVKRIRKYGFVHVLWLAGWLVGWAHYMQFAWTIYTRVVVAREQEHSRNDILFFQWKFKSFRISTKYSRIETTTTPAIASKWKKIVWQSCVCM